MVEHIGRDVLKHLPEYAFGKVLLFTSKGTYARCGELLQIPIQQIYSGISPNTKLEEIRKAQSDLEGLPYDCIVAFGGGSVLDFAKAFRYYEQRSCPLIAIPTTAGTGSEATQFAVVYVEGEKNSLDEPSLLPDVAIADSRLIEHAPRSLKATCAMDAYCQAIESFWAKKATEESRQYALEAIRLCRSWLVQAVTSSEPEANEHMVRAAHLAGKAINISRTTAAHALSYKITSLYGIPHGHAVALTIAQVFCANLGWIQDEDVLLAAMKVRRGDISFHFKQFMQSVGLEHRFSELGITDFSEIVASVNPERLSNNPRVLSQNDLGALFLEK